MCMAPRVATSGELVRVAAVLLPCLVFCQSAGTLRLVGLLVGDAMWMPSNGAPRRPLYSADVSVIACIHRGLALGGGGSYGPRGHGRA